MAWSPQGQERINEEVKSAFRAAEEFARRLAPHEPGIVEDLWLNWPTPARFAEKYPQWYLSRWNTDVHEPGLDSTAQDVNVAR